MEAIEIEAIDVAQQLLDQFGDYFYEQSELETTETFELEVKLFSEVVQSFQVDWIAI